jgi:hypothetical protein
MPHHTPLHRLAASAYQSELDNDSTGLSMSVRDALSGLFTPTKEENKAPPEATIGPLPSYTGDKRVDALLRAVVNLNPFTQAGRNNLSNAVQQAPLDPKRNAYVMPLMAPGIGAGHLPGALIGGAVGAGVGLLSQADPGFRDIWLRDMEAAERMPFPNTVVLAGGKPVPTDIIWDEYLDKRLPTMARRLIASNEGAQLQASTDALEALSDVITSPKVHGEFPDIKGAKGYLDKVAQNRMVESLRKQGVANIVADDVSTESGETFSRLENAPANQAPTNTPEIEESAKKLDTFDQIKDQIKRWLSPSEYAIVESKIAGASGRNQGSFPSTTTGRQYGTTDQTIRNRMQSLPDKNKELVQTGKLEDLGKQYKLWRKDLTSAYQPENVIEAIKRLPVEDQARATASLINKDRPYDLVRRYGDKGKPENMIDLFSRMKGILDSGL